MGDFNAETNEASISEFCEIYNTKNIIKDKTCLKNPENPAYIDLMLTNSPRSFQNSIVIETGLSDFDKMTVTVVQIDYCKQKPSVITYRKFINFSNIVFLKDLEEALTNFEHFDNIPSNLFKDTVSFLRNTHLLRKNMDEPTKHPLLIKH